MSFENVIVSDRLDTLRPAHRLAVGRLEQAREEVLTVNRQLDELRSRREHHEQVASRVAMAGVGCLGGGLAFTGLAALLQSSLAGGLCVASLVGFGACLGAMQLMARQDARLGAEGGQAVDRFRAAQRESSQAHRELRKIREELEPLEAQHALDVENWEEATRLSRPARSTFVAERPEGIAVGGVLLRRASRPSIPSSRDLI